MMIQSDFFRFVTSTTVARCAFMSSAMLRPLSRKACAEAIAALTVE